MEQEQNYEQDENILEKFGRNLVDLAREGKIDPVIGRDERVFDSKIKKFELKMRSLYTTYIIPLIFLSNFKLFSLYVLYVVVLCDIIYLVMLN